jgi:B9 domain-containing protein 1
VARATTTASTAAVDLESSFLLQCTGQIVSGALNNHDYLYCRYYFTCGDDWEIIGGLDNGLSQVACQNNMVIDGSVVWNFPIDLSFKSTNIHGWPRIAVGVYGIDFFGRDVVRGYGSVLVPMQPGTHELKMEMFRPVANSTLNEIAAWIFGNPPEVIIGIGISIFMIDIQRFLQCNILFFSILRIMIVL